MFNARRYNVANPRDPYRFADAQAAGLHREGLGPDMSGLFLQSNLGIVTRMTIWLERRPAFRQQL